MRLSHGNDPRRGAHHDAQKSTSTTLPRSESSDTVPARAGSVNDGARRGLGDAAGAEAQRASANAATAAGAASTAGAAVAAVAARAASAKILA